MEQIEITANQARQMTGRCGRHQCALENAPWTDDADTVLDLWDCPGYAASPEYAVLRAEETSLTKDHFGPWESYPPEIRARRSEISAEQMRLRVLCLESWVLAVPAGT